MLPETTLVCLLKPCEQLLLSSMLTYVTCHPVREGRVMRKPVWVKDYQR